MKKVIFLKFTAPTRSGSGTEESLRKVKGTLHWVSCRHAITAEVRLYDRLFTDPAPDQHKDKDFLEFVNPDSLSVKKAFAEPGLHVPEIVTSSRDWDIFV